MKIGVEASVLQRQNKTGVDYYTRELLRSVIAKMPNTEFELGYFSLIKKNKPDLKSKNIVYKPISWLSWRIYNLLLRYFLAIPYDFAARLDSDIVFYPNFVRWPLFRVKKSVVVIYDTCFLDTPQFVAKRNKRYLTRFVKKSVNRSDHIITISDSTKQSIIKHYNISSKDITVINPAVNLQIYKPARIKEIQAVKKKYGIDGKYLLYMGTIEPRKNIAGIIRAYKSLPESVRSTYRLVLAGGKGWLDDEIDQLISESNPEQIVKTGYIDEQDAPILYSGAEIFIYPSFYEGWGMQILESMACGTPVITADNSSLPEAGGKAATYVRAGDDVGLTKAIEGLLGHKDLYKKKVEAGIEHSKQFTWEESGEQLKKVFEELYDQS